MPPSSLAERAKLQDETVVYTNKTQDPFSNKVRNDDTMAVLSLVLMYERGGGMQEE
jgi:hypothetical protein